jgi:hypothetical protein
MRIERWFPGWLSRHQARHPRSDWPDPELAPEAARDFYAAWLGNFARLGVTEDVADEASIRLAANPPAFADRHLPALLSEAALVWSERAEQQGGKLPDSREVGQVASRDCPECGGCGQTYRRFSAPELSGGVLSAAFGCLCSYGRWLVASRRKAEDLQVCGFPDLADYPELWDAAKSHPSWPEKPVRGRVFSAVRAASGRMIPVGPPLGDEMTADSLATFQGWLELPIDDPRRRLARMALGLPPEANAPAFGAGVLMSVSDGAGEVA